MFIASIRVRHFRCISDEILTLEPLTALVGPNGCGKSSFLKAIDYFFAPELRLVEEDFFARDTNTSIELTIEFRDLDPVYMQELAAYLDGDKLRVSRVVLWNDGRPTAKHHGYSLQHPGFSKVRAAPNATSQKELYEGLRATEPYSQLPSWTKQADLPIALKEWERSNPERCALLQDDGTYFGLSNSSKFNVSALVQTVFIPAVRDAAADAMDGKGSPITELLDIAFRAQMAELEELRQLEAEVECRYAKIIESAKQNQFRQVEQRLSQTMSAFVSDSGIEFDWKAFDQIRIPPPSADAVIIEDGFRSPVARTGHGVQRAFTLSILQEMAAARYGQRHAKDEGVAGRPLPTLLLLIEEPELFQHPNRQRAIAKTLQDLSKRSVRGVSEKTQVIYGTHNPLFVSISDVEQIRVLRKVPIGNGSPRATQVRSFDFEAFLEELSSCNDEGDSVAEWQFHHMKLRAIMNSAVNEGFFAKGVVLVEGDIDRAGILAACSLEGFNPENQGISVIQARGKSNLVRLSIIFRQFGICVFVVWDGDADKSGSQSERERRERENRQLYRFVGVHPIHPPVTHIDNHFAVTSTNLEKQVQCELGQFYDEFMKGTREQYGLHGGDAIKHQVVFQDLLFKADLYGMSSPTLRAIVGRVRAMAED